MLGKKISNSSKGRSQAPTITTASATTTIKNVKSATSSIGSIQSPAGITAIYEPFTNSPAYIKIQDNFRLLPRYSVALSRPHDESLPAEELDGIQLELEQLLSAVALRQRHLKTEFESLDREDRRQKKGIYGSEKQSNSPNHTGKRKRDDKKASKDNKYFGNQQPKLSKLKTSSSHSPAHSLHTDDSMDATPYLQGTHPSSTRVGDNQNPKLLLPKNDIPNKFWLSVEPYCMPITQEDIKLLDDLIEEYSGPLVPPIPELGPHYTTQWAAEDLRDEQDNANQNAKPNKRFTNTSNNDVTNMMKKGDKLIGEGITGPLTQRLVSALVEEDVISNDGKNTITNDSNDSGGENNSLSANRASLLSLTSAMKNGVDVERSVKKELIDLGILDVNDFPKEKEDEILNEIKRVRAELFAIAEYNYKELKTLHAAAKEEMKRLEIKRKLDVVDQEIIETYKKVWAAKQKRRPLTKQEKTEIFRLTEEQKRLSDQLESMPIPGFNSTLSSPSISSMSFMSK